MFEAAPPDIPQAFRALISLVILATEFERLSTHIEHLRNHPPTTRRYYKRVAYQGIADRHCRRAGLTVSPIT